MLVCRYVRRGRCLAQSSYLSSVDWSGDSEHIRVNTGERELVVVDTTLCRLVTDTHLIRDIVWSSADLTLCWDTLGAWSGAGTVSSTCRSHGAGLQVSGDDSGQVSLFSHPAHTPGAGHHVSPGHSSEVSRVSFLADDTRVVSVGGKDCAIMQWQVE